MDHYNFAYANVPQFTDEKEFKNPPYERKSYSPELLGFLSTLLSSCQKNKYPWEPRISASRYYPITDVVVDFGNAGNGTRMPFDSGWRQLTFQLLVFRVFNFSIFV
ncbi:hypothetical protein [Flavobacterium sp. B17]|uniref:hypothetical protein n=1 Tax=Flavobacterium sp. B17 TaxID=95618 RepID=UPI0005B2E17F|nr:hypothetical protein [Flavobacterium sp. B17]